jgi:hypothetical protein
MDFEECKKLTNRARMIAVPSKTDATTLIFILDFSIICISKQCNPMFTLCFTSIIIVYWSNTKDLYQS